MGGGLGSEFLKSESAHASPPAPHPVPGVPSAFGVAREARFACGSPRAAWGRSGPGVSRAGGPFPTLQRTFPGKRRSLSPGLKSGGRVPPLRRAPRCCPRRGPGSVNPAGRGRAHLRSAAAPAWRFAWEPRRPGVQPGWVDLSQTTENRGSKLKEQAAASSLNLRLDSWRGQAGSPSLVRVQAFEVQTLRTGQLARCQRRR